MQYLCGNKPWPGWPHPTVLCAWEILHKHSRLVYQTLGKLGFLCCLPPTRSPFSLWSLHWESTSPTQSIDQEPLLTVNKLNKSSLDVHLLQRLACGRVVQLQGGFAPKAHPHPCSPACHLLDRDSIPIAHCKLIL